MRFSCYRLILLHGVRNHAKWNAVRPERRVRARSPRPPSSLSVMPERETDAPGSRILLHPDGPGSPRPAPPRHTRAWPPAWVRPAK